MKGLNRTELTGLLFLAIIIIGITACAFLMKDCRGGNEDPTSLNPPKVKILDTIDVPASTKEHPNKSGSKKKSRKKKSQASSKIIKDRKDPFSDTITLY